MNTKTAMLNLMGECLIATRPNREIDATIWRLCKPSDYIYFEQTLWRSLSQNLSISERRTIVLANAKVEAPHYTGSLDAILGLLPLDWFIWSLSEDRTKTLLARDTHNPTGLWRAAFQHYHGGRLQTFVANSLPLACCASILQIYSFLEKDDE